MTAVRDLAEMMARRSVAARRPRAIARSGFAPMCANIPALQRFGEV